MALGLLAAHVAGVTAADKRNATLNANAIGLLASQPSAMQDGIAIADAVSHVESLRVLPIVGNGSLQSLNDLLFLEGVDVAILSSDSLGYARKHALYSDEDRKLSYLVKLANSSIVILVRGEATSLKDLSGRKVATGPATSDSFIAADLVFGDQQITVERLALQGTAAINALRDGTVDAAVLVTGESSAALAAIEQESGLRILPVSVSEKLADVYAPSILDASQYPNLMKQGSAIETVAAAVILAVFDWPKTSKNAGKLRKFDKALLDHYLSGLTADKVTNFSAAVPGWKPFGIANQSSVVLPVGVPGTLVAYSQ
jgi:TRAP-type uncharacterized transport system substrate-binding protein